METDSLQFALREEEWRNEKLILFFRGTGWTVMGLVICGVAFRILGYVPVQDLFIVGWGVANGLSLLWLRRNYRPWFGPLVTAMDALLLAGLALVSHEMLVNEAPRVVADHQGHVQGLMFLSILAPNHLRYSWKFALATTLWACGLYLALMVALHGFFFSLVVDAAAFVLAGLAQIWHTSSVKDVSRRASERDALARFLPGPALDRIRLDPTALLLGGSETEATVLFSDIRGFTNLSESLTAPQVVALLNEYFGEMVEEIFHNGGILDKFIGDGICAVFVAPLGEADHAERAVRCGQGMLRRLDHINVRRVARGEPPLAIGVGLHSGKVMAGNIGSRLRMEYTHIGDTVNTASRVESLTKELKEPLLITEATWSRVRATVGAKPMPPVPVRGKAEPLQVYAVGKDA